MHIIRLDEAQALGPFFTRFLNAQLWRGETFYMQVDAHTEWRQGWDVDLVAMLKRTPSYPAAVLSNYPASFDGKYEGRSWPRYGTRQNEPRPQGGLCGGLFDDLGLGRLTVRLTTRAQSERANTDTAPHKAAFVAAGFLFTPASFLFSVPFDPFLPYIFHGEELSLSMRLWTHGYEIFTPTVDLLSHDYGRHDLPKFWETVNMNIRYSCAARSAPYA